jgi:multisubunit Na+/H+ antiporter MnhB subunit
MMFVYPQSGNQFVVEGFIIGFLNLGCALSVTLLIIITAYCKKNLKKNKESRLIGMISGFVGFIFCFRMIRSLYILKNNWYGHSY